MLTGEVCNILPHAVKVERQNNALPVPQNIPVPAPAYLLRNVLAANLARLMEENADRSNAAKLSKHCIWPVGSTKAGKRVSERQIRYVLETHGPISPSATLDLVTALANAFRVPPWRLLVEDEHLRAWAVDRLGTGEDTLPPVSWQDRPAGVGRQAAHKNVKRKVKEA